MNINAITKANVPVMLRVHEMRVGGYTRLILIVCPIK